MNEPRFGSPEHIKRLRKMSPPPEICSVCHDEGTYWEDVAGDGGSRMQVACDCIPPHVMREVLDRTLKELMYIDLHGEVAFNDVSLNTGCHGETVVYTLTKHLHQVLNEVSS